jgi:hypothetical protein
VRIVPKKEFFGMDYDGRFEKKGYWSAKPAQ